MHIKFVIIFINIIADELRHLYDVIFTVQDCVSTVAFMSQCGLSQDPSSCIQTNENI